MLDTRGALTGLGLGIGLMYFLDSARGARRRARVRDRLAHAARVAGDSAGATARDVAHRTSGIAARVRNRVQHEDEVDDRVLIARVRSQLGRVVSHPRALEVDAVDGAVTLRGPVLEAEVPQLLTAVEHVRGVTRVVNELEPHREAGNIPALQGGSVPPGIQPDSWQRRWAPATRLVTATASAALAGYGALRRDVPGALMATAGVGLLARAATNLETRRLTGIGARRRAVDIQKTLTVDAPVATVFDFWTRYENFPRFMSRVMEVRPGSREGQSHWKVAGPGGVPVEFDSEVSALVPNEVFAWRTVKGATVAHSGIVRFESLEEGRTRIDIRMSYNPPGGWFGHGVASAFGVDPKSSLDEDLARMKTFLETGRPARDAAKPEVH
jgi:uncharacterized membrane protein